MNPMRLVSGAIALPAHAAAAVIGTSVGVATTGARTAVRVVSRVVERASGADPVAQAPVAPPATRAPARKAPARKAPARKAPSEQAAVLAPALGLTEAEAEAAVQSVTEATPTSRSGIPAAAGTSPDTAETDLPQPGTEPLMDPATAKAVASESEVLRRAADTDKG